MSVPYFVLLTAYDSTHRRPNIRSQFLANILFTYVICKIVFMYAFFIVYSETKQKKNALFGNISSPKLCSYFLMILL